MLGKFKDEVPIFTNLRAETLTSISIVLRNFYSLSNLDITTRSSFTGCQIQTELKRAQEGWKLLHYRVSEILKKENKIGEKNGTDRVAFQQLKFSICRPFFWLEPTGSRQKITDNIQGQVFKSRSSWIQPYFGLKTAQNLLKCYILAVFAYLTLCSM